MERRDECIHIQGMYCQLDRILLFVCFFAMESGETALSISVISLSICTL